MMKFIFFIFFFIKKFVWFFVEVSKFFYFCVRFVFRKLDFVVSTFVFWVFKKGFFFIIFVFTIINYVLNGIIDYIINGISFFTYWFFVKFIKILVYMFKSIYIFIIFIINFFMKTIIEIKNYFITLDSDSVSRIVIYFPDFWLFSIILLFFMIFFFKVFIVSYINKNSFSFIKINFVRRFVEKCCHGLRNIFIRFDWLSFLNYSLIFYFFLCCISLYFYACINYEVIDSKVVIHTFSIILPTDPFIDIFEIHNFVQKRIVKEAILNYNENFIYYYSKITILFFVISTITLFKYELKNTNTFNKNSIFRFWHKEELHCKNIIKIFYKFYTSDYFLNSGLRAYGFEVSILVILFVIGMSFSIFSNDFIMFFVSFELQSFSFFGIIFIIVTGDKYNSTNILSNYNDGGKNINSFENSISAIVQFFFILVFSSLSLLYGFSLIYYSLGSFDFSDIKLILTSFEITEIVDKSLVGFELNVGIFFVFIGIISKIGIFPFHFWVINVYKNFSSISFVFIGIVSKIFIFTVFFKFYSVLNMSYYLSFNIFYFFGIGSIIVGLILALSQFNFRVLVGVSSIVHSGYILLGFGVGMVSLPVICIYILVYVFSVFTFILFIIFVKLPVFTIQINMNFRKCFKKDVKDSDVIFYKSDINNFKLINKNKVKVTCVNKNNEIILNNFINSVDSKAISTVSDIIDYIESNLIIIRFSEIEDFRRIIFFNKYDNITNSNANFFIKNNQYQQKFDIPKIFMKFKYFKQFVDKYKWFFTKFIQFINWMNKEVNIFIDLFQKYLLKQIFFLSFSFSILNFIGLPLFPFFYAKFFFIDLFIFSQNYFITIFFIFSNLISTVYYFRLYSNFVFFNFFFFLKKYSIDFIERINIYNHINKYFIIINNNIFKKEKINNNNYKVFKYPEIVVYSNKKKSIIGYNSEVDAFTSLKFFYVDKNLVYIILTSFIITFTMMFVIFSLKYTLYMFLIGNYKFSFYFIIDIFVDM